MVVHDRDDYLDESCFVTIGKFDGLHLGHKKIIYALKERAAASGKKVHTALVSFVTSPYLLTKNGDPRSLLSEKEKRNLLEELGIDHYIELPFDEKTMNTPAQDFFDEYVSKKWNASGLTVGDDFRFGKNREGDNELLSRLCLSSGISFQAVDRLEYEGVPISSSRIKNALDEGRIEEANAMCGYAYSISGRVIHGRRLGRQLGFPTINIQPEDNKYLPRFGVYGCETVIDGKTYRAIANIGVKPTVDDDIKPLCEVHILSYSGDLYESTQSISFLSFIRPEIRFASLDELKNQIEKDKKYWTNKE